MAKSHEEMAEDLEDLDPPLSPGARLTLHEQICALRWKACQARLGRLENIGLLCAGTLIVGLGSLVITLSLKL
jgi:hypothetical protein